MSPFKIAVLCYILCNIIIDVSYQVVGIKQKLNIGILKPRVIDNESVRNLEVKALTSEKLLNHFHNICIFKIFFCCFVRFYSHSVAKKDTMPNLIFTKVLVKQVME